jgi:hypothetical protein
MKIGGTEIKVAGRVLRIARLDADKFQFLEEDPEQVVAGLRSSGSRVDLFTFMQRLPDSAPKYQYPMEMDNFAAIPISTFEQWWMKQIGFKARNKAKQAEKKGVVIREVAFDEALARGIWEIYNECPIRQGRRFSHYGKTPETVYRESATYLEHSQFIGAFLDDRLVGFIKLVWDEPKKQAGLMNIVSLLRERDKAPSNALVAAAVRYCAEHKIEYLTYANFAYGKKQSDSLSDFKERNAFVKMDVPRYFVPLTSAGALAFRLGLHRRMSDYVPESVASKLRDMRNAWYARKFQTVRESS